MRALFERGIVPDMLVGTSAGALNAALLATNPTAATNEQLVQMWLNTRVSDIFPKPKWMMILRGLLGGNGLDDDAARTRQFLKSLPAGVRTFGDLKVPLYLTTADLQTGRLYLYGDNPNASLVEAALASTALPVVWDPEMVGGHQFVDGGVVANLPVSVALDRGANVVYALDLQNPGPWPLKKGLIDIARHSLNVLNYNQGLRDIARALSLPNVTLHYISLGDIFSDVDLQDFSHTAEMIELGYRRAKDYLDHPTPNVMPRRVVTAAEVTPPGATPYVPPDDLLR